MTPASKSSLKVPLLLQKFVVRAPRAQGQPHTMDVSTSTPPATNPTLWLTKVSGCQSGTSPVAPPAASSATIAATTSGDTWPLLATVTCSCHVMTQPPLSSPPVSPWHGPAVVYLPKVTLLKAAFDSPTAAVTATATTSVTAAATITATVAVAYATNCGATMSPTIEAPYN